MNDNNKNKGFWRMANALKELTFPDEIKDWNKVIHISVEDDDEKSIEWIGRDGQWHIEEGKPQKPDFVVSGSEKEIITNFTSEFKVTLNKPNGMPASSISDSKKYGILLGYTCEQLKDQSEKLIEEARENDLFRKSLEYKSVSQSTQRLSSWIIYAVLAFAGFVGIQWLVSEEIDESVWTIGAVIFFGILLIKILIEVSNYQKYHRDDSKN